MYIIGWLWWHIIAFLTQRHPSVFTGKFDIKSLSQLWCLWMLGELLRTVVLISCSSQYGSLSCTEVLSRSLDLITCPFVKSISISINSVLLWTIWRFRFLYSVTLLFLVPFLLINWKIAIGWLTFQINYIWACHVSLLSTELNHQNN